MDQFLGIKPIVDFVSHWYGRYQYSLQFVDPRVKDWPLISSPVPTLILIGLYLTTVLRWGPNYMKNRKPMQLKWPLVVYNLGIMLLNFYIATEILYSAFFIRRYNWFCQLVDTSDNYYEMRIARALYWYYISKLIEFMDTFFFILRKKDKQLTFLHVYHHSTMFGLWWIGAKWVPGGSAAPGALVNSYVHVLMYTYYGLSALGPRIQKFLWWKKYITIIQLIQFLIGLTCGSVTLFSGCKFTLWMQYAFVSYSLSFIFLFGNFYLHAYMQKSRKETANGKAINGNSVAKNGNCMKSIEADNCATTNGKALNGKAPSMQLNGKLTGNGNCKSHLNGSNGVKSRRRDN